MSRSFVVSVAFVALAGFALMEAPQASARSLGGFSINKTGQFTPTPDDPRGGGQLCTYHLRKQVGSGWVYHLASGYDVTTCMIDAGPYLASGYVHNPIPGFAPCQCHSGYNGMIIFLPPGNGSVDVQDLAPEQAQAYEEGLERLRHKYQLDKFQEEHELLLQAVESIPADR